MKSIIRIAIWAITSIFTAMFANAQTQTYVLNKPFACDAASVYPVTSVSEFTCRVNNPQDYTGTPHDYFPNFLDVNDNKAELYWWPFRLYVITPNFVVYNATFQITEFTVAKDASGNPITCTVKIPCTAFGTVSFSWSGTDTTTTPPTPHSGTFSAQWANLQVCGNRCWYHPLLQSGATITVEPSSDTLVGDGSDGGGY